jgi:hypothetical protein
MPGAGSGATSVGSAAGEVTLTVGLFPWVPRLRQFETVIAAAVPRRRRVATLVQDDGRGDQAVDLHDAVGDPERRAAVVADGRLGRDVLVHGSGGRRLLRRSGLAGTYRSAREARTIDCMGRCMIGRRPAGSVLGVGGRGGRT